MKTCECIQKMRQLVIDKTGDPEPEGPINDSFGYVEGVFSSTPTLQVLARKKKKDGSFCINPTLRFHLVVEYCPVCGKPLKDSPSSP